MNNSLTALALGKYTAIKSDKLLVIEVPGEEAPTIIKSEELEKLYIEARVELNNTKLELEKLKKELADSKQREKDGQNPEKEIKIQEQSTKKRTQTTSQKKSRVGRTEETNL